MSGDGLVAISQVPAEYVERHIRELGALLHACVHAGASIGFILPFATDDSEAYWRENVLPAVRGGTRVLSIARHGARLAGSVQLDHDTPPNQPHRAEVRKLLVHPDFRRRGIATALMADIENHARRLKRSLITLDTRTGDAAEPLYAALGYKTSGVIPGYCRDPFENKFDSTTIMYKAL